MYSSSRQNEEYTMLIAWPCSVPANTRKQDSHSWERNVNTCIWELRGQWKGQGGLRGRCILWQAAPVEPVMGRGRAEDRLFRNHRICQDLPETWVTPSPYIVFTSWQKQSNMGKLRTDYTKKTYWRLVWWFKVQALEWDLGLNLDCAIYYTDLGRYLLRNRQIPHIW